MTNIRNIIALRIAAAMGGLELPRVEREEGQTLAEYALILALIAVLVIGAVLFLSGKIGGIFSQVGNAL
jgi:pilus assembly protein Flp/PilA